MDQQATRTKPRSYTEDYKRKVVDLVVSSGRTSTAVAGEVGLHPTLLCRWVRQYGAGEAEAPRPAAVPSLKPLPVPTADQAAEIARLRRECDRLRMERDILKKLLLPRWVTACSAPFNSGQSTTDERVAVRFGPDFV